MCYARTQRGTDLVLRGAELLSSASRVLLVDILDLSLAEDDVGFGGRALHNLGVADNEKNLEKMTNKLSEAKPS
jgi:hypothetical protein